MLSLFIVEDNDDLNFLEPPMKQEAAFFSGY